jgi:hypothetical protein
MILRSYDLSETTELEACYSVRGDQVVAAEEGCRNRRRAACCVVGLDPLEVLP